MIGRLSKHRKAIFASGILALVVLGAIAITSWRNQSKMQQGANDQVLCLTSGVSAVGCDVRLEYAVTEASREQGLSGRDGLGVGKGMLFVFDATGNQCMWMKDMQFNLDIVWLDDLKNVAAIEKNLSPASYPHTYCHQGSYVLEVAAGQADQLGLRVDKQVTFPE
jgi:uncharacterized membrane protein (UPF0127 family)